MCDALQIMCQIMCKCVIQRSSLYVAVLCSVWLRVDVSSHNLGSSPFRTSTHGHSLELSRKQVFAPNHGLVASRPLRSVSLSRFFPMKTILHTCNATTNKPSANLLATTHAPCHNSIYTNLHTSSAHNHCQHMQHSSHKCAREIHATNISYL